MESSDLGEILDLSLKAPGQPLPSWPTEPESNPVDIDPISGFPTMQQSFILSQMVPLSQIESESIKKASEESRKVVKEQFQDISDVRIARIGTSLEKCAVPRLTKRSSIKGDARDLTTYEINMEDGESQWLMVALEKKACYIENADAESAKFIIEEDQTETGYVRLRLRKPDQTTDFKKQLGEKWYISSTDIAEEFQKTMAQLKEYADKWDDGGDFLLEPEGKGDAASETTDGTGDTKKNDQVVELVYNRDQAAGEAQMSDQAPADVSLQGKQGGQDQMGDQAPPDADILDQTSGDSKMCDQAPEDIDMHHQIPGYAKIFDQAPVDVDMEDQTSGDKKLYQISTGVDMQSEQAADAKMPDQEAEDVEMIDQEAEHDTSPEDAIDYRSTHGVTDTHLSGVSAVNQTDAEMDETLDSDNEAVEESQSNTSSESIKQKKSEDDIDDIFHFETNVSVAFPCATWPRIASRWQQRYRPSGWPTAEVMKSLISKGCLMIPRAYPGSEHEDIEWQIALDIGKLTDTLNETQRQCLILLKILRYHFFDIHKILTPEHMIFLLFWVCEKIPCGEWTPAKLSVNFRVCLDMLLGFLENRYMPHYFYDECNMLKGISTDHLDELAERVQQAREKPTQQFYTFSTEYLTSYFPTSCSMQDVFEQEQFQDTEAECTQIPIQCLKSLTDQLVKDRRYEAAIGTYEDGQSRANRAQSAQSAFHGSPEDHLSNCARNAPILDDSISIYEFLIKHFRMSESLHSYYDNLACMYHSKYAESPDEIELRGKAYEAFENALKQGTVSPASKTDFCNFLLHVKDHKRAIDILQEVMEDREKGMSALNAYGALEKKTVHAELQPWIEQNNELEVWSLNFSQYLLVKCLTENGQQPKAIPILKQMRGVLKEVQSNPRAAGPRLWTSHVLFGYAAKSLGKLKVAAETFRQLNEKVQPSLLAQAEYETCVNMCAALGDKADLSEDDDEAGVCGGTLINKRDNTSTENDDVPGSISENTLKNETQQETEQLRMSAEAKVKEKQFFEALKDFEELCAKRNSVGEAQHTPEFLMFAMTSSVDVALAIEILKFLIEAFPESSNLYLYYSSMACMYHVLFCQATEESEKEELRCLAKQGFERARNDKATSALTSCHYANFLYSTGQCEAALELAEAAITDQKDKSPQEWCERTIIYGQQQIKMVDEKVAREIEYAGRIEIAPVIYSFYILINCCLKLEKSDDARDLVMKMKESCDRLVSADIAALWVKLSAQLLLGHAAREAQDFSTGEGAFEWVYENDARQEGGAKNDMAKQNMMWCRDIAMSQPAISGETSKRSRSADRSWESVKKHKV